MKTVECFLGNIKQCRCTMRLQLDSLVSSTLQGMKITALIMACIFTLSNDTISLTAFNVVMPNEIKPPTQVGSTSANERKVKAASILTYTTRKKK
jgi:hypothetical protein